MGRIRKLARWTFSYGGTGIGSPVRAESSAERAAREHGALLAEQNRLLAEQNRLLAGRQPTQPQPSAADRAALKARIDAMYAKPEQRWRAEHVPGSKEYIAARRA